METINSFCMTFRNKPVIRVIMLSYCDNYQKTVPTTNHHIHHISVKATILIRNICQIQYISNDFMMEVRLMEVCSKGKM